MQHRDTYVYPVEEVLSSMAISPKAARQLTTEYLKTTRLYWIAGYPAATLIRSDYDSVTTARGITYHTGFFLHKAFVIHEAPPPYSGEIYQLKISHHRAIIDLNHYVALRC